jgi:hypothetical protein
LKARVAAVLLLFQYSRIFISTLPSVISSSWHFGMCGLWKVETAHILAFNFEMEDGKVTNKLVMRMNPKHYKIGMQKRAQTTLLFGR